MPTEIRMLLSGAPLICRPPAITFWLWLGQLDRLRDILGSGMAIGVDRHAGHVADLQHPLLTL